MQYPLYAIYSTDVRDANIVNVIANIGRKTYKNQTA